MTLNARPQVVIVSGMLGAGKTTLIVESAKRLIRKGRRVGVITNDQGTGLIDTSLARVERIPVGEVSGGCFCCRFSDFLDAALTLREQGAEVIFGEPVGSCLDIAATVVRPLMRDEPHRFRVAPLTVLVDPARVRELDRSPDADLSYLFDHQLAEADLVCLTKADVAGDAPPVEGLVARRISARSGEGVDEWLEFVLGPHDTYSGRQLAVDYRRYAAAEAALAWLNWRAELVLKAPTYPALVVGPLMERLDAAITETGGRIVHVKVLDQTGRGYVRVSQCANGQEPTVEGRLDADPSLSHELLVNARVVGDPERISRIVDDALSALPARVTILRREAFRPAEPKPERRA
jgi:Ni2+-binding GTPase involved in maturation of urease and hydrogenase